jgi:hypothetical protein
VLLEETSNRIYYLLIASSFLVRTTVYCYLIMHHFVLLLAQNYRSHQLYIFTHFTGESNKI